MKKPTPLPVRTIAASFTLGALTALLALSAGPARAQATPPAAPAYVTVLSGDTWVSVTWPAAPGASGYNVKRSLAGDDLYETIATIADAATTNYLDLAVVNGLLYSYVVAAFNAAGESPDTSPVIGQPSPGGIYTAFYDGIAGLLVSDLTNSPAFPDQPSVTEIRGLFEPYDGDARGNNFGTRMVGYFSPPATANYHFFLTAADTAVLYLSPDDQPANKVLIASEPNPPGNLGHPFLGSVNRNPDAPENRSSTLFPAGIPLVAGHKYFIEALHKTGAGVDDILAVAVEGGPLPPVVNGSPGIAGTCLSTALNPGPAAFLVQPADQTVVEGRNATFVCRLDGTPPYAYQLLLGGVDPVEGAAGALHTGSGILRLTLPPARLAEDGSLYVLQITGPDGSVATSAELTLRVTPDTENPKLLSAAATATLDAVLVAFSEPLEPASAETAAHYVITNQAGNRLTLVGAALQPDRQSVLLATAAQVPGSHYCLVVNQVRDTAEAAHEVAPNSTACFDIPSLTITQQPRPASAPERGAATFSVAAASATPPACQWQQSPAGSDVFADIPGATNATYSHGPVLFTEQGARFRCQVSAAGSDVVSSAAALSVIDRDLEAPRIVGVAVAPDLTTLWVRFSEPVDPAPAAFASIYSLDDLSIITAAVLDSAGTLVTLTASAPLTPGAAYALNVQGVADRAAAANLVPPNAPFPFVANPQGYAEAVLADEPVVYLRFEEESGDVVAHNLGLLGDAADGSYLPAGAYGEASGLVPPTFQGFSPANRAASFNGGDWITVSEANVFGALGTNVLKGAPQFTIEAWAKPTFTSGRGGLVSQPANGIHFKWVGPYTIQIASAGGGHGGNTSYPFPSGQWHHLAGVGDASGLKVYYDARLVLEGGNLNAPQQSQSDANIVIGGGSDIWSNAEDIELLRGQIDEVAIYRKALNLQALKRHYDAALGAIPLGPNQITRVVLSQGYVVIDWIAPGALQSASALAGPWTDVPGATAPPYATPLPARPTFWRVLRK
jgi:hypothetical protein